MFNTATCCEYDGHPEVSKATTGNFDILNFSEVLALERMTSYLYMKPIYTGHFLDVFFHDIIGSSHLLKILTVGWEVMLYSLIPEILRFYKSR